MQDTSSLGGSFYLTYGAFFLHKNLLLQTELVWLRITKNLLISLLRHFFLVPVGLVQKIIE